MVLVVLLRRLLPSVENRTVADRFVGSCTVTNSPYTLGMVVVKGGRPRSGSAPLCSQELDADNVDLEPDRGEPGVQST